MCYKLKYKALIQVHRINLMIQWENAIKNTCNDAKVQLLTSSNEIQHDCDFYIINMINTSKRNKDEFKDIGILICDEIHLLCTEVYSKTLYSFQPKYLIGLSATPFKNDGSSRLLELYFGPEVIFKHLYRPFNIYSFYSNYIPKYKINNKSIDWNSVLEDLDNNEELFDLYIKVIQYFSTRNILVLVKRINIGKKIYNKLKELNENVDLFVRSQAKFNYDCRILVSSYSKSGVGFDFPKMNTLLLASDIKENLIQYLGRVCRLEDNIPMVIDVVFFKFFPLLKHWYNRKDVYSKCGGIIKNIANCFPELFEK